MHCLKMLEGNVLRRKTLLCSGVGCGGARGAIAPQKFWFGENPGKIHENLGNICENLRKIPENLGKNGAHMKPSFFGGHP